MLRQDSITLAFLSLSARKNATLNFTKLEILKMYYVVPVIKKNSRIDIG